ncbi:MAG: hypothetical protein JO326_07080 [Acetobacteraceae bacterium]|nr:hypothetical protein [Acetobacteraceae bacterium]
MDAGVARRGHEVGHESVRCVVCPQPFGGQGEVAEGLGQIGVAAACQGRAQSGEAAGEGQGALDTSCRGKEAGVRQGCRQGQTRRQAGASACRGAEARAGESVAEAGDGETGRAGQGSRIREGKQADGHATADETRH